MSQVPTTISFIAVVLQFAVPDLVRTAEYYRDVLGFGEDTSGRAP